jgi:hypothetical protein
MDPCSDPNRIELRFSIKMLDYKQHRPTQQPQKNKNVAPTGKNVQKLSIQK